MKNIMMCAALALVVGCGDKDDEDTGEEIAETTEPTAGTGTGTGTSTQSGG